jgi:hypothetical protein
MTAGNSVGQEGRPSGPTIHVVVTCTDRKTIRPRVETSARNLPGGTLADRLSAWTSAFDQADIERIPAERLYAGDHWQVARSLSSSAPSGLSVRTWICSAGLGLIRMETLVSSYAATFTPGHTDSVAPSGSSYSTADWWTALAEWKPTGTEHRTIASIALDAAHAGDTVLVALSEHYLRALRDDIADAVRTRQARLAILSVGTAPATLRRRSPNEATIADCLLPAEARLKGIVGGAMQSLNVRLARRALNVADEWVDNPAVLGRLLQSWAAESPDLERFDRSRSDDEAIKEYIREARRMNPKVKHTTLLHALRASGRACEQSRLRALFNDIVGENSAGDTSLGKEGAT